MLAALRDVVERALREAAPALAPGHTPAWGVAVRPAGVA
jgi:hypothetical protein